jgi:non-specific serine/threonine protein kinase
MILQCSLGMALIYTQGMSTQAHEALVRALRLAEQLEDFDYRQRASYGLCLFSGRTVQFKAALAVARQYEEVAHNRDLASGATAAWLVGLSETYLAAHVEASERLQRAIDQYPVERRGRDMIRFGADLRASAFGHLAINLLSRGLLDRASRAAMGAIEEARRTKQPVVLCLALAWAVSLIFPRLGDLYMARSHGDELIEHAQRHLLRPFHAIGVSARGAFAAICGDHETGIALLRSGLAEMQAADYRLFYPFFQAELAAALGAIGRIDDGLATIDEALRLAVETDYHWFVPEILRSKGELHARCASNDQAKVVDLFRQSMTRAREQQALYWELRAATSLARLLRDQGRRADATACLQPVYDRFTEGFDTADLVAAKRLLQELRTGSR